MRYLPLLFLLAGCIDSSMDTEVNTVVYQFADIAVGDKIPNTTMVWAVEDAHEVLRLVNATPFRRPWILALSVRRELPATAYRLPPRVRPLVALRSPPLLVAVAHTL